MTYFADLTPYVFIRSSKKDNEVNVGWLDHWHRFEGGAVPEEALERIFALCQKPVHKTRGYHSCELCRDHQMGWVVQRGDVKLTLGSAEIRAPGGRGVEYACPDLIYHYIQDHGYKPPQDFVDAVLNVLHNNA
jgi:hypothetical protein